MNKQKLPAGWKVTTLGDICNLVTDGTHEKTPLVSKEEGMPLVTSKDLSDDGVCFDKVLYITKEQHKQIIKRSKPEKGDILYSKIGTIGKPTIVKVDFEFSIKNVALFKLKKEIIYNRFLRLYLLSAPIHNLLLKQAGGGNQKFIPLNKLKQIEIILPPLATQKAIVSILEKAEKAKEWRKKADDLTKDYLKSVFLGMFGNKKEFETIKIKEVIEKTSNDNPSKDYPNKEFEYIDISSIDNNKGKIISYKKLLGKDAPSRAKQKVKYNDLIISTVRPNLNSVALIPKHLENQICSTGFCVLRANTDKISPEFLFHVSRSSKFIGAMVKIAKGASYPAVSDRDIKNYEIPLPPISLQNKFASIVKEVEKLKEYQKKSREEIDNLFNALMQKAFKGELII